MSCYHHKPRAVAFINCFPTTGDLRGKVEFFEKPNGVLIVALIQGLPQNQSGFYGFHIHEGATCTGIAFADTQSHYNPQDTPHPHHAGDLPPLLGCNGHAYLQVLTNRFRIPDIIGRTVVIHNNPDDFTTQPAGNAGTKIGCGVIKKM